MKLANLFAATAALLGLCTASLSFAVDDAAHPCKADEAKLCADVKPGEGRIAACMKEHKDELSDACKKVMAKHHAKRRARKAEHEDGGEAPASGAAAE